jgi:hypothetical protein
VNPTLHRLLILVLVACMTTVTTSCTGMQRWLSRDESQLRATRLQQTQLKVMRYADEYSGRVIETSQRLNAQAQSPAERLAAQNWRLTQATSAFTIASGPNPTINALDMIVLATLSRMTLEGPWARRWYGARAMPLLDVHRGLEAQAWSLADGTLSPEQVMQLRGLIEQWRAEHPNASAVTQVRFTGFTAAISGRASREAHSSGGLFSLIGLDPLSNLDPAVRELEQTRQLAERTIYYLQRAPDLLNMQVESLAYQLVVMPEAQSVLQDSQRISLAAEAAVGFTDTLPAAVATEREAALRQIDTLLRAEQLQLQSLLREASAELQGSVQQVENTLQRAVDHAFWRLMQFLAATCAALLLFCIARRYVART